MSVYDLVPLEMYARNDIGMNDQRHDRILIVQ